MAERWAVPVLGIVAGAALAVAVWLGTHQVGVSLAVLGIMVAYVVLVTVGARHSATLAVLAGRAPDERWRLFDLRATAAAGGALILAVLVLAGFNIAHGGSGAPYVWLAVLAGVVYLVAVVAQSRS